MPSPNTIPLILGRLTVISYVAHRLTSTMQNISSRMALRGMRGSGLRPASQAMIHNPGTMKRASDRPGEIKIRTGAARISRTQCHLSIKMAVCRRTIVMRFNLRFFKNFRIPSARKNSESCPDLRPLRLERNGSTTRGMTFVTRI